MCIIDRKYSIGLSDGLFRGIFYLFTYVVNHFMWAQCFWVAHNHTLECANVSATMPLHGCSLQPCPGVLIVSIPVYLEQSFHAYPHQSDHWNKTYQSLPIPTVILFLPWKTCGSPFQASDISLVPNELCSVPFTGSGFDTLFGYPANEVSEPVDLIFLLPSETRLRIAVVDLMGTH